MAKTVVGVFNTYTEAEAAVRELTGRGLRRADVSIVATEQTRGQGSAVAVQETENLASGAGTGAAVGGAAGLMLGLAALAIPGIGPIVAAGPIAAALTGAGLGAAAGGIIGGLAKMGIPQEQAERYQNAIRRGATLVAVHAQDADVYGVESILNRQGAVDVEEQRNGDSAPARPRVDPHNQAQEFADEGESVRAAVPSENLATGRRNVRLYDPDQSVAPDLADTSVRELYTSEWSARCSWEDFSDAWRYGHSLAINSRYAAASWPDVEADARPDWEGTRKNGWDKVKDVVRRAWEHVRGSRV
jgi:hypothetical protein